MGLEDKRKTAYARGLAELIAALLLASAIAAAGCGGGGKGEGPEVPEGGEKAAELTSERFRPAVGSVFRYLRSAAGPEEVGGVPVNFPLEGDWDFSEEMGGEEQRFTVVEPFSAPGAERFPQADLCLKEENGREIIHRFYTQDGEARRQLGMHVQTEGGRESWCSYSPPLADLAFPLNRGKVLEEEVSYSDSEGISYYITHRLTVIWIGEMRVPAGVFPNTALVQDYEIMGGEAEAATRIIYRWYSPEVGLTAGIASRLGEDQAAFNRAASFRRLVSFEPAR